MVFDKFTHTLHNDLRFQAFVEVVDVAAELILRSFQVILHPAFDCLTSVVRSSATDTPAAVEVHSSHKGRLQHLDKCVVDILVGPLSWLADSTPLLRTRVPSACNVRLFRLKSVDNDFPQLFYPLGFGFLYPSGAFVRTVVRPPMMGAVDFINSFCQVLVRDEWFK